MPYKYNYTRKLVDFSKTNRKKQTDSEKLLWRYLRNRRLEGYKFRRQYPVLNYILDFYCVETKLAIELDGSHHRENKSYDNNRTSELEKLGIKVIRFWDNEILKDIDEVLEVIAGVLKTSPHPLLKGEGNRSRILTT